MNGRQQVTAAVARGAELLGKLLPCWDDGIGLDRLDMSDPDDCLLAQLWGCYELALYNIGIGDVTAADYGFTLLSRGSDCDAADRFDELTAAWRDLIAGRRTARGTQ